MLHSSQMGDDIKHFSASFHLGFLQQRWKTLTRLWALSYTSCKVAHSAAQLSLLVSDRHSHHFHAQHPRCVSSKCTCAHLCAQRCVGLKMRCGQAHCWRIAILRQQKAIVSLTNKSLVYSQWRCIFRRFHFTHEQIHFLSRKLFASPTCRIRHLNSNARAHLAFKGNRTWHSNWFNSCYTQNTSVIERLNTTPSRLVPYFAPTLCPVELDTRHLNLSPGDHQCLYKVSW